MAYATLQNLKDRLGSSTSPVGMYQRLTDRVSMATANDAVGQELVDQAQGVVNGYLAGRYLTPVDVSADTTLAVTLRDLTLAIAAFKAYASHPLLAAQVAPAVRAAYDEAISLLKRIADGAAALPGAAEIPSPVSSGSPATAVGSPRVTTDVNMAGMG